MSVEWLDGSRKASRAAPFRELICPPAALPVPGAYDGLTARLARQAGFKALYLSGAALSASMGLPDLGVLTLEDVWRRAREIIRASDLPLIIDCDTGFGEVLNIMRAVRELEEIGAACIQIEDQQFPKKCGHLNDKRLIPVDDMCRKIAGARRAADQLVICARTDAAGTSSLDDAIQRANRYVEAGADLIFVEALTIPDHFRRVRQEIRAPLLANMTEFGRTPQTSQKEWASYGFNVVIYPVSALRVASRSVQEFYGSLAERGDVAEYLPKMMPRAELYDTIQYYDYEALDASVARTVLEGH